MEEIKNKAPNTTPNDKQGSIINNGFENIKNYPFDVPDTLPGCYQEYRGWEDCKVCQYRLPCARASAGGDNE